MKRSKIVAFAIWAMIVVLVGGVAYNQGILTVRVINPSLLRPEHLSGQVYSMMDDAGKAIMMTSHQLTVGDRYLDQDNKFYEVDRVSGLNAHAKFLEQVDMTQYLAGIDLDAVQATLAEAESSKGTITMYSTHTDESYIRGDGTDSIQGNGGIKDVAESLATALRNKGYNVIHSLDKFDPHDDSAYSRSRRTAEELLKKQPLAIFDVHRDAAVPPEQYVADIGGESVTQVRMVVGRQNPKQAVNDGFAKQLKAVADKVHPGLIKGIYYGRGAYNQDLSSKAMLLELGSEKNSKAGAEKGIALFADVIAATVSGNTSGNPGTTGGTTTTPTTPGGKTGGGTTSTTSGATNAGAGRAIMTMIGILAIGGIGFLAISTGGFKEMGSKLRQFGTSEFANFLGRFRRRKNK